MGSRRTARAMAAAMALCTGLCGCGVDGDDGPGVPRTRFVRIAGGELLASPEILTVRVYQPQRPFTLPATDGGAAVDLVGFYLSVVAEDAAALDARVVNLQRLTSLRVERIPAPAVAPAADVDAGMFNDAARTLIRSGAGLFWVEPPTDDPQRFRVGVALPQAEIWPQASVELYASTTSTGDPLGGDRITLAREFFYMAALGDSAMWGNGLLDRDKFSARVARQIEDELGVYVVRNVRAVSGATIAVHLADDMCFRRCGDGEVPEVFTSITTQANTLERPELYDLILLDGCGNDVQLERILTTVDNTALLTELSGEYCMGDMANLLIRVRALAPQAPIVVTGYFPFVSEYSDLSAITTWASANGIELLSEEDIAAALENFVKNSAVFQTESGVALAAAVELVNSLDADDPPIAFVDPEFAGENATFAPDAWLWGLTENVPLALQLNIALQLFPEDPMLDERVRRCAQPPVAPNLLACVYGALGHPNVAGAQAYTTHIVAALRTMGVLPPADPSPAGAP